MGKTIVKHRVAAVKKYRKEIKNLWKYRFISIQKGSKVKEQFLGTNVKALDNLDDLKILSNLKLKVISMDKYNFWYRARNYYFIQKNCAVLFPENRNCEKS